jgi:hypothetical protein
MTTIGGLPAHILLVHAVVVLVPLTALLIVLVTVWPAARARLTLSTAIVAVVTLISVPVTTDAGEWLERRVQRTDLLRTHTELGDTMLPWAIGLAVVALAVLARQWHAARTRSATAVAAGGSPGAAHPDSPPQPWGGRGVSVGLAVLAVVVAVGSVVTVYEIGDSGARASWQGKFSQQAQTPPGPSTAARTH